MKRLFLFALFISAGVFSSCEKDERDITTFDNDNIQAYIRANNLQMTQYGNTGVYYQIIAEPTGRAIDYSDQVFMTYSVRTLDGKIISNDLNQNRYTGLLGYMERKGAYGDYPTIWRTIVKEALQKNGGSVRILTPSAQAFGNTGYTISQQELQLRPDVLAFKNIPGNASLDCTLNLAQANNITEFEDVYVQQYIKANNITGLTRTKEGLYYQIITQGTGAGINASSTIGVAYTGKLTSGTVFDSSTSASFAISMLDVEGWKIGLPLIQQGGKIRLIIPPTLAYGAGGLGPIPPHSILDFEITVNSVTN